MVGFRDGCRGSELCVLRLLYERRERAWGEVGGREQRKEQKKKFWVQGFVLREDESKTCLNSPHFFFSKKWKLTQRNYPTWKQELIFVEVACK